MTITRELECNGVIERFIWTLKEPSSISHRFQSLAEARWIIGEVVARPTPEWAIERLGLSHAHGSARLSDE
jgi:hypothetical protein